MYNKNVILVIAILFSLAILQGCTSVNNGTSFDEIEYLEQKSIAISLATYTGTKSFLVDNSTSELKEKLLELVKKNSSKDVAIEYIKINTSFKEGERITVITSIEEKPFTSILFHNLTYEYVDGKWLLLKFEEDA